MSIPQPFGGGPYPPAPSADEEVGVPQGTPTSGGPAPARARLRPSGRISVVLSLVVIAVVVAMAVLAPLLRHLTGWDQFTFDATAVDGDNGGLPLGSLGGVSPRHWLGVEPGTGRDIFMRIAYGARVSLLIAVAATVLTITTGVIVGLIAGYYGGWADALFSRLMDFLMAFPALIFMIAILSAIPASNRPLLLVGVLAVFGWPYTARVVRGQVLSLRRTEFVEAARACGASELAIVFKEVLPNLRGTTVVLATLAVPSYVGAEAGLSFLGVGVTPPTPSWGQMVAAAAPWYAVDPAYFVLPGLFLFATVFAFTVLGDELKASLDENVAL